jgi:hypothetical protein
MSQKAILIYSVVAVWCAVTAVKAAIVLVRREPYVGSWWDAGVAGTGRKLGSVRTVLKLLTMLGVSTVCVLAVADVLEQGLAIYGLLGLIAFLALVELSAPKSKRR